MPSTTSNSTKSVLLFVILCLLQVWSQAHSDEPHKDKALENGPHESEQLAQQSAEQSNDKKCFYVSSYHVGHEWSDSIEKSIRETLAGHCELRQADMDTKRHKSPEAIFNIVNSIIKQIEDWQPDVVITSDDNAAKYLIAQHYRDDKIPFVFSGVNWTVEEYGFPYKNVTGIVEVAPIKSMFREALTISNSGHRAVFIGPNTLSEKKSFDRMALIAAELNIQIEPLYYSSYSQWKRALPANRVNGLQVWHLVFLTVQAPKKYHWHPTRSGNSGSTNMSEALIKVSN